MLPVSSITEWCQLRQGLPRGFRVSESRATWFFIGTPEVEASDVTEDEEWTGFAKVVQEAEDSGPSWEEGVIYGDNWEAGAWEEPEQQYQLEYQEH